jgi:diaminopimelate decarboxylase
VVAEQMTVNLESETQFQAFERLARWAGKTEFGLRVGYPPWNGSTGAPSPISRFGFHEGDVKTISCLAHHPSFVGFHSHVGGDKLAPNSHRSTLQRLLALAAMIGVQPRIYNLGGGLRRESALEMRRLCRQLRAMVPREIDLVLEPGAWFTANAGYALGKVISARHRPDLDATLFTIDLSRDCHLRWCDLVLTHWWGCPPRTRKILVFGPTCHEGDFLGAFEWTGPLSDGSPSNDQWMLFGGVTGYAAAFNCGFNGIDRARVVGFGSSCRV